MNKTGFQSFSKDLDGSLDDPKMRRSIDGFNFESKAKNNIKLNYTSRYGTNNSNNNNEVTKFHMTLTQKIGKKSEFLKFLVKRQNDDRLYPNKHDKYEEIYKQNSIVANQSPQKSKNSRTPKEKKSKKFYKNLDKVQPEYSNFVKNKQKKLSKSSEKHLDISKDNIRSNTDVSKAAGVDYLKTPTTIINDPFMQSPNHHMYAELLNFSQLKKSKPLEEIFKNLKKTSSKNSKTQEDTNQKFSILNSLSNTIDLKNNKGGTYRVKFPRQPLRYIDRKSRNFKNVNLNIESVESKENQQSKNQTQQNWSLDKAHKHAYTIMSPYQGWNNKMQKK